MLRRHRWKLLSLILAIAVVAIVVRRRDRVPEPPNPPAESLEPAVARVVREAREKVTADSRSAANWGEYGETLLANELEDDALVCFERAAALEPGNGRWPYLQAVIRINRGDREAALPRLREAIELSVAGDFLTPRLVLIEQLLLLGRLDELSPVLDWCQPRAGENVRVPFDTGLAAVARADFAEASKQFVKCLSSPYARKRARSHLSFVQFRLGNPERAAELQREAARLPDDAEWPDAAVSRYLQRGVTKRGVFRRAEQLEAAGRFAEAAALTRPLVDDFPDDDVVHLSLGRFLTQAGDPAGGEAAVRRAIALAPEKTQQHYYLSLILIERGKAAEQNGNRDQAAGLFSAAADAAKEALKRKPDYGAAHMALGLANKKLQRRPEALASFEAAVRCNPDNGELRYRLGELLEESGRREEAALRFEEAIKFAPPGAMWLADAEKRLAGFRKEKS